MIRRIQANGGSPERELHTAAVNEVAAVIAQGGSNYVNAETANQFIGLETLNDSEYGMAMSKKDMLVNELKGCDSLCKLLGGAKYKDMNPMRLNAALESAAYSILYSKEAARAYTEANRSIVPLEGGKGVTVSPADGDQTGIGLESFDPISVQKYLPATAIANAQAAISGSFEEVWFPQQIVPAGQNGVDVQITIPKIFSTTAHNLSSPSAYRLTKTSLIQALLDPSILESEATSIVPNSDVSTNLTALVPATKVPVMSRNINGNSINTLPILFGTSADVLVLSYASSLFAAGVLDETDSLDNIINIGTVYTQLTFNNGTRTTNAIIATDISGQLGAVLSQVNQGLGQEYQTTMVAALSFDQNLSTYALTPVASGALTVSPTNMVTDILAALNISGSSNFQIVLNVNLSARANIERGNVRVDAAGASIAQIFDPTGTLVYDVNVPALSASNPLLAATGSAFTVTPLGYQPLARRTNSNLRQNGTIIDSNTMIMYRFPVNLQAPIISQAPIGAPNNVTLEGLGYGAKIRNNGRAVQALANAEIVLSQINGTTLSTMNYNSPFMGAEFVTPTYIYNQLDVAQAVTTMNSKDALDNLRGQLIATVTNMVNQMLTQSHYLAALEMTLGDIDAFDIILATDPKLAPHFMESGDTRTFGDGRRYFITKSNNNFFHDATNSLSKLYISFRRAGGGEEIHPLDFGRMLITPPITYDVAINRNGRTVQEIHTVPRCNSYVTLPILGRLDVLNLNTLYPTLVTNAGLTATNNVPSYNSQAPVNNPTNGIMHY